MKPTPGLWWIANPDERCGPTLNILGPHPEHAATFIAQVRATRTGHTTAGDWETPCPEVASANARLIAAAPDLLYVARGVILMYERQRDTFFARHGIRWETEPPAIIAARAAIAIARQGRL